MAPSGSSNLNRSANACEICRRRKVKCSGTRPCQTCNRNGLECRFENTPRRGYSQSYVQGLLDKIKKMEEQLRQVSQDSRETQPIATVKDSRQQADESTVDTAHGDNEDSSSSEREAMTGVNRSSTAPTAAHDETALSPVTDLASGPAFESRVRSILRDHANSSASWVSPGSSTLIHEEQRLEGTAPSQWRDANELVDGVSSPNMLSKAESHRLFETFISLLGVNQHFLDPRKFCDSMDLLYQSASSQRHQLQTVWFTQYLLVMAIGKLISSPSDGSHAPPGNMFFAKAMKRLPPSHQLNSHGVIAVEILCLAGLYLQWCDRKHEAYVYVGTALRLAMALGCSLPHDEQEGLTSEICHRTRVWWTVYMLDRRLSAGLGLPMGADDRQLRAEPPRHYPGFQPPLPLIINVQIARATGEIMTSLYGSTTITQTELIRKIQKTLQSLYETGRSIPSAFSIDFSDSNPVVSRTSASLYLMLFQAIILCIRPIILQCVKEKVELSQTGNAQVPMSPVIARLCNSCHEAAVKSILILQSLTRNKSIALFGYFDLDATFSAAFILVMMGFVQSNDLQKPPEGLSQAAEVLQYLSDAGNKAAQHRFHELKQFCCHVWSPDINNMPEGWAWLKETRAAPGPFIRPTKSTVQPDAEEANDHGFGAWNGWYYTDLINPQNGDMGLELINFEDSQVDLSHEANDIYSCFNDPNLPLTGVDDMDWAEIGKVFHAKTPDLT